MEWFHEKSRHFCQLIKISFIFCHFYLNRFCHFHLLSAPNTFTQFHPLFLTFIPLFPTFIDIPTFTHFLSILLTESHFTSLSTIFCHFTLYYITIANYGSLFVTFTQIKLLFVTLYQFSSLTQTYTHC